MVVPKVSQSEVLDRKKGNVLVLVIQTGLPYTIGHLPLLVRRGCCLLPFRGHDEHVWI